ncbi:MAG: hypothetical protein J1F16_06615 [Muribaculaceae bacterium]|nr:hypothetical protein [Muribaculaceae bacterium]
MVKIGIIGAHTPIAGEIIRILIHHPETELVCLYSPANLGKNAASIHHGLIGEETLNFTDKLNLEDIDLLIITENTEINNKIVEAASEIEGLKIILTSKNTLNSDQLKYYEAGLSEINRKPLVRGVKEAYILSPTIVPALIALAPLATFLLLNSDIDIEVSAPEDILKELDLNKEITEVENQLKKRQTSFNGKISLKVTPLSSSDRGMNTQITMSNLLPVEEIEKIYEQIYDDHNFTYITKSEISPEEVEGTQKVVINISKPSAELLSLKVVSDARLRGGAGDVVHVMNLFFGLHEKTGLTLKASKY